MRYLSRFASFALFTTAALCADAALFARDARACGGCFNAPPVSPTESESVITGHKMVLSLSKKQTTLYDQIAYAGNPSSFAWVLPVRGQVTVGLSADLLFQTLDAQTRKRIIGPPPPQCPSQPFCGGGAGGSAGSGGSMGFADASVDSAASGVQVVSQATVGPYATVQLSSTDPAALETWLADNGFLIPPAIQPVLAAYVAESFDFLALKLVPGAGVSAMRPVRVTTPGASAVLPLRMVAAGTGANVPITLWVVAEGTYETKNFPTFRIDEGKLVWDWATASSNYRELRDQGYDASAHLGWLAEVAVDVSPTSFRQQILNAVQYGSFGPFGGPGTGPASGGYEPDTSTPVVPESDAGSTGDASTDASVDSGPVAALDLAAADLDALFSDIPEYRARLTRLTAVLPRASLGTDLDLRPATIQTQIPATTYVSVGKNPPKCPPVYPCPGGSGGSGGSGLTGAVTSDAGPGSLTDQLDDASMAAVGCAVDRAPLGASGSGLGALGALAGLAVLARRRRASRP